MSFGYSLINLAISCTVFGNFGIFRTNFFTTGFAAGAVAAGFVTGFAAGAVAAGFVTGFAAGAIAAGFVTGFAAGAVVADFMTGFAAGAGFKSTLLKWYPVKEYP